MITEGRSTHLPDTSRKAPHNVKSSWGTALIYHALLFYSFIALKQDERPKNASGKLFSIKDLICFETTVRETRKEKGKRMSRRRDSRRSYAKDLTSQTLHGLSGGGGGHFSQDFSRGRGVVKHGWVKRKQDIDLSYLSPHLGDLW